MITTTIVLDHRNRTKDRNEGPLEVRVTYNRKVNYVNTGIKVRRSEWIGGTIVDRPDSAELNERLSIITHRIEKVINEMLAEGLEIDVAEVRRRAWQGQQAEKDNSFLDWVDEQIPLLNMAESRRYHYIVMYRRLVEFGRITSWKDVTTENIYLWDHWLHGLKARIPEASKQQGEVAESISDGTVWNYHKNLKAILNRAVKMDKIPSSPYSKLTGEFSRGIKENVEYLTDEEMAAFESLRPVRGTEMEAARDLFVFQMYTGLSYSDAQAFDISKYRKVDGKWVYVGERIKTGVPFVNQLLPPVIEVLERYGWQTPHILNQHYNKCLKMLGMAAGIKTKLHSHLARHTFATFALRNGVKIENLSRMLGHTNITQTQRYAKVLAESVHEDFDKVGKAIEARRSQGTQKSPGQD